MRWSSSQMRPWLGAKRSRLARSWISGTQMAQAGAWVMESPGAATDLSAVRFGRYACTFTRRLPRMTAGLSLSYPPLGALLAEAHIVSQYNYRYYIKI